MRITYTHIANFMIETAGMVICVFGLILLCYGLYKHNMTKKYLLIACSNMLVYNLCLLNLEFTQVGIIPSWRPLVISLGFGTYLFALVAAYFVSLYVVSIVSEVESTQYMRIMILTVLMVIELLVILLVQMKNALLRVDLFGRYIYGSASSIGFFMVASFMFIDVYMLIRYGECITYKQRIAFITYIALPVIAIPVRKFFPGVYIVALASCVSMFIMMGIIVDEQRQILDMQRNDNEQLKVDLMLGQIQPHFLFNVLYVIQEICLIDAETASEAIADFSRYLRHNMDSISINTPIPFTEELDHVIHYVSLQQLRFGDSLYVNYDLDCYDFEMPTLTLQPLVENAIRYGVRKRCDGKGTVTIRTKEYPKYYKIHVIDNGPGFVVDKLPDDGISHMGLKNVRERLNRISGGELIIDSCLHKGTDAIIVIPKQ